MSDDVFSACMNSNCRQTIASWGHQAKVVPTGLAYWDCSWPYNIKGGLTLTTSIKRQGVTIFLSQGKMHIANRMSPEGRGKKGPEVAF